MWLLAGILGVPLIEIALFVTVGAWLGLWATLAIVVGTAVAGIVVIRRQGLQSMAELRRATAQGRDPSGMVADSAIVAFAGVLLILPGFLTDTFGLLLLLRPLRRRLIKALAARVNVRTAGQPFGNSHRSGADVIDGEYFEVIETPPEAKDMPPSGWTRP